MSNPIKGMIAAISNYGVGKTTFALECGYHPKDIIFINDDVKTTGLEKEFKKYVDLVKLANQKPLLEFHESTIKMIETLPKTKVIIWDTWTQFQASFPVYVKANPDKFRNPNEYSAMGRIKAGEQYQDAYRYEGGVLSYLKDKCDMLILTFHIKPHYENNVAIPGKYRPAHDRAIEKYADLRIWLTPNPGTQIPAGLVLKNISRREITKNGIRTNQVLPLRVPVCNWEKVLNYWDNPVGNRELNDDERPNGFELSMIDGSLTPEDKRMYEIGVNAPKEEVETIDDMVRTEWIKNVVDSEDFPNDESPANKVKFINWQINTNGLDFAPVTVPELLSG